MIRAPMMIVAAGAALLAGCANGMDDGDVGTTADRGREDCFWPSEVNGFTDAGDDQVVVSTGPNEAYLFETFGYCPDLDFAQVIGFEQVGPGMICRGIDVNLVVPSTIGNRTCPVRMIRKLSDEEMAAR